MDVNYVKEKRETKNEKTLAFLLCCITIVSLSVFSYADSDKELTLYAVSATYSSTRSFLNLLDESYIHYTVYGVVDDSELVTVSNSSDGFSYDIDYWFESDLESAALRVFDIITYNDSDFTNVVKTVNRLNAKYNFVRLYADKSDNTVTAASDLIFRTFDVGEICLEATLYMTEFLDAAYKELKIYNIA